MLRIRLQRRGRKKRPIHHIVVADSRKPRDGKIIEDLGRFDNVTPKNQLDLNRDRALYWLKQGAQPTDTIRSIFKKQGIMYEMHLIRWGKSEEEIEAALAEWREEREAKEKKVPTRKERQQALLEAEEKEFQKQLKKKAEEAAREKAKQEALAAEEEEEEKQEEQKEKEDEPADTGEEEVKMKAEVEAESGEEAPAEAESEEPRDEDGEDESEESEESEEDEEPAEDEEVAAGKTDGAPVSTDMLAKEAISYIEDTPLEELEGFLAEEEDRVTVRRAWEIKHGEGEGEGEEEGEEEE